MLIDLNAMADAPYMSDNWRRHFRHTVREADRLGLKIGVNTCPGWPCWRAVDRPGEWSLDDGQFRNRHQGAAEVCGQTGGAERQGGALCRCGGPGIPDS